jgi:hypothetical protein
MTYRRIEFFAVAHWDNPLKHVEYKPFLGDITFPVHSTQHDNTVVTDPYSLLRRYYIKERADGPIDVSGLKNFLIKKSSGIYVIKGDIGAGKTWFLRYLLGFAIREEFGIEVSSGIIDMWNRKLPDVLDNAHWLLDDILTEIVDRPMGLRTILKEKAHVHATTVTGEGPGSRPYEEELESFFRTIMQPSQRMERNLHRLKYLEDNRIPIVIGIDNIDVYSEEEQSTLFGVMVKLLRYANVRLVVPVRPSTHFSTRKAFDAGQFYYDEMEMQKLDYATMLRSRFRSSVDGVPLADQPIALRPSDFQKRRDNGDLEASGEAPVKDEGEVATNFPDILEVFLDGYGFVLLEQLADTDVRQALKFVNRVFFSDNLLAISNLAVGYHFISAAMLRRSRDFNPDESYILDLFDDDHPDKPGNSLIRFRVLEYFVNGNRRIGDDFFFIKYFERLGYDKYWVNSVLQLFVETGLLRSADGREATLENVDELVVTKQGRLYFHTLVKNKWYIYCIKRGMAIKEQYITRKVLGRVVAREEVEDGKLVEFFEYEEGLENTRIKQWADDVGESEEKYGKLLKISETIRQTLGLPGESVPSQSMVSA